ncbi:heme o synthase [Pyrobaculum sp. 3827-6]|uniref:heme o synthase n=1 Tax=Pyrobaculum sp. 3827-6 TaxID=2983604 RepID=UPI0021D7EA47|nr:heme o synthase [Pyrobaculum sp. 3827-6]MCU7786753.1 heme o synthase [Pyrobaculum sp. 3827-6]
MSPYLILLKPRVIWLLVLASAAGYVYATPAVDLQKLLWLLVAAALSTGGSAAFNHYWERDIDARMARTANRPLPRGLVDPRAALIYSLALSAAGVAVAFVFLTPLVAFFTALGWFFYAVVYTIWLKRRSWLNVLAGGFAGNATFLGGYALGRGYVDLPAVLLSFAIYLWIPAHIWALVYRYRADYIKAGVPMLPTVVSLGTSQLVITSMNILSALYAVVLYLAFVGLGAGLLLVALGAAMSLYSSLLVLKKRDDASMWKMYKMSSPVLTFFLLALLIH